MLISEIQPRIEALEAAAAPDLSALQAEVAALRSSVDTLSSYVTTAVPALGNDVGALSTEIQALVGRVAALEAAPAPTPFDPTSIWDAIGAVDSRVEALENAAPGGGSLPSGTVGDLTVRGRLTVMAEDADASQAIDIVVPKALREEQAYPFIRFSLEEDDGSRTFMAGLVAHHIGTNHNDHVSFYVADDEGNRVSVWDIDTFRPHSTRRFRLENLLVQFGTGTKEAILEVAKLKIAGTVRTLVRDAQAFLKGN